MDVICHSLCAPCHAVMSFSGENKRVFVVYSMLSSFHVAVDFVDNHVSSFTENLTFGQVLIKSRVLINISTS